MLSVVIPALNAAHSLGACLDGLAGADEIVVADGGSTDGTSEVARERAALVVEAEKGRGPQLIAGAAKATGDWLLFLHADTILSAEWPESVREHCSAAPHKAAILSFGLNADAWQARLIERGVALRTRLGLPYGDQGLLVSRALYEELGGYRPLPLFEDVDLIRRIGRRRLRLLKAQALTSAERWQRDGWFRRSARNLLLLGLHGMGVRPDRLARLYNPPP